MSRFGESASRYHVRSSRSWILPLLGHEVAPCLQFGQHAVLKRPHGHVADTRTLASPMSGVTKNHRRTIESAVVVGQHTMAPFGRHPRANSKVPILPKEPVGKTSYLWQE